MGACGGGHDGRLKGRAGQDEAVVGLALVRAGKAECTVAAANGARKQQVCVRAMVGRRASKGVCGQAVVVASCGILVARGWIGAEGGARGRDLGEEGHAGLTGWAHRLTVAG
jgi:hypothetical protein